MPYWIPYLLIDLSDNVSKPSGKVRERMVKKCFALSGASSVSDETPERAKRFSTIPTLFLPKCFEIIFPFSERVFCQWATPPAVYITTAWCHKTYSFTSELPELRVWEQIAMLQALGQTVLGTRWVHAILGRASTWLHPLPHGWNHSMATIRGQEVIRWNAAGARVPLTSFAWKQQPARTFPTYINRLV